VPVPKIATSAAPLSSESAATPDAGAKGPCDGDDFGLPPGTEADVAGRVAKKRGTMGTATKQMVASSHRLATEAGLAILRSGGTAADAFVATVLVQDVVLPGVTSTAGLTGVLVYEAKTKKVTYIHGGVADPIDPARRWRSTDTAIGKLALVPGAPAAYAEVAKRFGKKPLAQLVEPAAKLAANGFPADRLYARSILGNRAKLEKSAYGKKAFFRDGRPIGIGETLKLEEFASTLRSYGKDPTWFHRGSWAREAVSLIAANGGELTAKDFETYAPEVAPAMHGKFMGRDIFSAGHGGAKLLVSLGALEQLRADSRSRPEAPYASADALEMLLRVQRATSELPMLRDRELVMKGSAADADVAKAAKEVALLVRAHLATSPREPAGTHSSAAVVVDAQGNVVVGTHTIETLNWGEGLFVGGVPLSTSASITFDDPAVAKTRMRIDPLSDAIVFEDGAPRAALAVYGSGLHPADVQLLDAVIARGVDAEEAVLEPRVGYFTVDFEKNAVDHTKSTVDPRFDAQLLCTSKKRGFTLSRSMPGAPAGFVDTGFPTLVTIAKGLLHGMTPDPSHIEGVAAGD
jgi:gamma-glutamyltranspeptidase/glutathione hydrolase